jgi:hypothetical protein
VVRADEKLTAFLELELAIRAGRAVDHPSSFVNWISPVLAKRCNQPHEHSRRVD